MTENDDDERHLKEYEAYAKQLKKDLEADPIKQYRYWLENRLKATESMIRRINNKKQHG